MHPAAALARALARTSGEAALRRALPVFAGLMVIGGLLFGGNGLEPATVVDGAAASPATRALLWGLWLVLLTPTLAAVWQTGSSLWLRSLPAPRWWHLAIALAMSLLAESPWVALWAAGGGATHGLAALGGALAGHAAVLARPPGAPGLALVAAIFVGLVLAPPWLLAFGTWPIALVLLRAAWLAAPARPAGSPGGKIAGPAPIALALAQLVGLTRGHAATLIRGAMLVAVAAAAALLAARNNAIDDGAALASYAVGFLAPAALAAGSAIAGPMLAAERRAAWLLAAAGGSPRLGLAALGLAAGTIGAGLGALAGALVAARSDLSFGSWMPIVATTAAGAALTAGAALAARWAEAFGTRGPGRLVLALFAALVAALASLAALGPGAPAAWLAAVSLVWLVGHVRSAGPARAEGRDVLLEMVGVRKRLGARVVLEAADLSCAPGQLAVVLGENGAGKSTLLRIAAGIVEPDRGAVRVAGASLAGGAAAPRRALGYVPDTSDAFAELTVAEVVALVAAIRRAPPPATALRDRLGLAPVWRQRMRTLSFGQVKRAYMLTAAVGEPALWLLDEPSNGLDPDGVLLAAELLREHTAAGGGAVVATNDAAFVARIGGTCHRIAHGRLAPAS